jgi:hypothetical protein
MRIRVYAHVPPATGPLVGRSLPLRIGDLAYSTTVIAVEYDEHVGAVGVVLVLELPDSDLRFEALEQSAG